MASAGVTRIAERYDRNAELYERWWAPVLAPAAARLLERAEPWVRASLRQAGVHIVDIGTGTGALAIEAVGRWPEVTVTGVDVAAGMLELAARRAARLLPASETGRIRWLQADADASPLRDASADLCISSFVLQLVPDRPAALREALRILRPGGRLCFVTWQAGRDAFDPADEFDEAVYDLEIEEPEFEEETRAGDLRSARSAARELREAGFQHVSAETEHLDHLWTRDGYLDYKLRYDELGLMGDIDSDVATRLEQRARERLAALPADAFRWRPPIIQARGDRPPLKPGRLAARLDGQAACASRRSGRLRAREGLADPACPEPGTRHVTC